MRRRAASRYKPWNACWMEAGDRKRETGKERSVINTTRKRFVPSLFPVSCFLLPASCFLAQPYRHHHPVLAGRAAVERERLTGRGDDRDIAPDSRRIEVPGGYVIVHAPRAASHADRIAEHHVAGTDAQSERWCPLNPAFVLRSRCSQHVIVLVKRVVDRPHRHAELQADHRSRITISYEFMSKTDIDA